MTSRLSALVLLGLLAACGGGDPAPPAGKPVVFVSIPPQAAFVEAIAGDRVQVEVLLEPGHSPATFEPGPKRVAALSRAAVFFRIGVPYETAFLPRLTRAAPELRVVDTRAGVPLRSLEGHDHDHADGGDPGDGMDPHIWLDPVRVKAQAKNVAEALMLLDPAGGEVYQANLERFLAELDALDARLATILAPARGREFLVFHPSWGYLAERYGLAQVAIEARGKEPGGSALSRTIAEAKDVGTKTVFVQPQFRSAAAEAVAEAIGGRVEMIDPLARDWAANLEAVAQKIAAAVAETR